MLCLSRKKQQALVIDEKVTIRVGKLTENRVTLVIEAGDEVRVRREEIEPNEQRQD